MRPGPVGVISGASGAEPAASEELSFLTDLAKRQEIFVRGAGSLLGHSIEATAPANVALAALALREKAFFAPMSDAPIERVEASPLRQIVVTSIGYAHGEGMILLPRTEAGMNDLDANGRPIVVVTGVGVVTSLGAGIAEKWAKLTGGRSGVRAISRFPTEGLRTRIAGTVDFLLPPGSAAPDLCYALAERAATEAIAQSGLAIGEFPGPLFIAVAPAESNGCIAARSSPRSPTTCGRATRPSSSSTFGHRSDLHNLLRLSGVAHRVADRFGTLGSPISINTACASDATAIHMGVEAIRRGETDAALVVGADGSITSSR